MEKNRLAKMLCLIEEGNDVSTFSHAELAGAMRLSTRRGWTVVASAFVIMFATFGAAYSFTAFFAPLQQAFGASRGEVSLAFSINVLLFFLLGAVSGPFADRFGSRATCLFGTMTGSAGLMFAAAATTLWQVYIGFGLLLGVGIGFAFVPSIASVQRWFMRRRGLASGIAVSGIGFGTLILPLAAAPLIEWLGWRDTWRIFGLLILVAGGVASLFISNSPEKFGALPDGGVFGPGTGAGSAPVPGVGLRDAVMSRPFLLLYLSLIVAWSGVSIPFVHLVPFAEDHGLSHGTAVAIFGLVGVGSITGRFLLGSLADRLGRRAMLAATFGAIALMQAWLLIAMMAWQIAIFAFVFGTCYGGIVALFPALTADYFGSRNASGIIGVLYTAPAFGSFIGPKLAGDAFDKYGSYSIPIAIGAACACVAAALVMAASEPPLKFPR